jgi:hypothetical protein
MKWHIHKHLITQVTYTRGKLSYEPKLRVGTWDGKHLQALQRDVGELEGFDAPYECVIALDLVGHGRNCIIINNLQKYLITPSYTFQIYIMISTSQYDCMNLKSNNVKTNVNLHCVGWVLNYWL